MREKKESEDEESVVEPKKSPGLSVDQLLDALGSPGRCQALIYILMCLNVFPVSLNFMAMSFFGAKPNQTCRIQDEWFLNETIPKKADGSYESCLMYVDPRNHSLGTQSCTNGYTYYADDGRFPITAEWDLVCDKAYLGRLAQTIFFAGVMVGGLIFGYLGDRFGRRPIILLTLYGQAIFGVITYFSVNLAMFMCIKFLQGIMLQGLQTSNTTAVMELYQTRYRTKAGIGIAMLATASSMVIGLVSYLIPHWRYMQLTISVPTIITIIFIWLLPESLRWLLSSQRVEEAKKVSERYLRVNRVQNSAVNLEEEITALSTHMSQNAKQTVQGNIKDLFKVSTVRLYSIVLFFLWFTASVVYYGITLSIPNLGGNPSLSFFIVGALETTSRFVGYFIINRFGRRIPMSICYVLSGIVCMISGCLATLLKGDSTAKTFSIVLALIGRATMGQCFAFIAIVTSEIFPTVLRTVGAGWCAVWSRIGGMVAPQTLLLDSLTESPIGKASPYILFGVLSIVAGGLTLLLPETLNVPLPDSVRDVQNVQNGKKVTAEEEEERKGRNNLAMAQK